MRDPKRLAERRRGAAPLARRMKSLQANVVCVVVKAIVPDVNRAIAKAELDAAHEDGGVRGRAPPQHVAQLTALLHALDGA